MKSLLPIIFATIAAIGNAMFALGQKKSSGVENGLLFVGVSALVAVFLAFVFSPLMGVVDVVNTMKGNWKAVLLSGVGLFLTYLGFNLLYSRFGASQYILYAVLSIITTTIIVGIFWLREPVNVYHKVAIIIAIAAVVLFSIGQSKA
jgi:drug/metabolite transporter (DMT)-like permease